MAAFHVFVDGATDSSPGGTSRLATAIANQYGLPAADLLARLQKGRFRVKGNIDRATAEQYVRDLQRLGAQCTIEEATAQNSQRVTPTPFPAIKVRTPSATASSSTPQPAATSSTPPAATSSTPPATKSGTPPATKSSAPPATKSSTPPATKSTARPLQSGLAAALASNAPAANLGALEEDGAALSLSSVDGDDVASPSDGAFAPPLSAAAPRPKPSAAAPTSKPAKPKDEPVDLFAPPDAQEAELVMDLAPDEIESKRKRVSTLPAGQSTPESTSQPTSRATSRASSQPTSRASSQPTSRASSQPTSESTSQPDSQASQRSAGRLGPLAEPRVRFAAGVLLAVVLGFVPAHVVASLREKSAFAKIDDRVRATQEQADTPETYAALDSMRATERANKESAQRNAALIALAVWALAGGGLAFAWFRKIPWDRYV